MTAKIDNHEKRVRRLDEIESDMSEHALTCPRMFHRNCIQYIALGREYIASGGTIISWDPYYDRQD